jgi:hypothetical protein
MFISHNHKNIYPNNNSVNFTNSHALSRIQRRVVSPALPTRVLPSAQRVLTGAAATTTTTTAAAAAAATNACTGTAVAAANSPPNRNDKVFEPGNGRAKDAEPEHGREDGLRDLAPLRQNVAELLPRVHRHLGLPVFEVVPHLRACVCACACVCA